MRIANGFGWTWVVLGDGTAGAARVRDALASETSPRDRATGLLLAGWLEASAGDVVLADDDLTTAAGIADELDDEILRADAQRHQAFLAIQQGRSADVLALTSASLTTYRRNSLPWETAASLVLAAYGSIMVGATTEATENALEALEILNPIGDSWGLVHAEAMLGGIAQAEHRFDDASRALVKAAQESQRLGFVGQAALHLATLARVQQRAGRMEDATASYNEAITAAAASGDGRLAATARLNLARLHRGLGDHQRALSLLEENERWYESAGGGEGALLNRCLLYAETNNATALEELLLSARGSGNDEMHVFALDALARIAAEAMDDQRANNCSKKLIRSPRGWRTSSTMPTDWTRLRPGASWPPSTVQSRLAARSDSPRRFDARDVPIGLRRGVHFLLGTYLPEKNGTSRLLSGLAWWHRQGTFHHSAKSP